jgi:hypothetical protein
MQAAPRSGAQRALRGHAAAVIGDLDVDLVRAPLDREMKAGRDVLDDVRGQLGHHQAHIVTDLGRGAGEDLGGEAPRRADRRRDRRTRPAADHAPCPGGSTGAHGGGVVSTGGRCDARGGAIADMDSYMDDPGLMPVQFAMTADREIGDRACGGRSRSTELRTAR